MGRSSRAGSLDACDELAVVANTADDIDVYGVHVSPDPDLVTYWLADEIDERGWGLRDDTLAGDGRARARRPARLVPARRPRPRDVPDPDGALRAGDTLTEAHAAVVTRSASTPACCR